MYGYIGLEVLKALSCGVGVCGVFLVHQVPLRACYSVLWLLAVGEFQICTAESLLPCIITVIHTESDEIFSFQIHWTFIEREITQSAERVPGICEEVKYCNNNFFRFTYPLSALSPTGNNALIRSNSQSNGMAGYGGYVPLSKINSASREDDST